MVKSSDFRAVKKCLETFNVCNRCILRFFGMKEYTSYVTKSSIEKTFQQLLDEKTCDLPAAKHQTEDLVVPEEEICPPHKKHHFLPCAACLGILQESCDDMVAKVEEATVKSGHEFDDFVLQLSFPVVLDLRDRLFHLYLQEQLKDSYTILCNEIPSVKDVWKWVIGSQLGKITKTDFTPYSNFQISLLVTYPDTAKECFKLFQKCPEAFPNRKKRKATDEEIYTRTAILKAVELVSSEINSLFTFPPSPPDKNCIFHDILCTRSPLYLGGRYNKYSRELSQTPWIVDGERRMDSSVNELITDVVQKRICADKIVFSASGREDVDVKMLGNGRPFVLEILNPRRIKLSDAEMKDIENEINASTDSIAVKDLQIITKQDTLLLKEGEEQKRKTYSAICIVKKTLSQNDIDKLLLLKDLKIQQKTPIRVLHRRNLATRERLLHSIEAKLLDSHLLHLKLETQAGTYVKEFVHGDFGRTSPNLGMLLDTEADILELDVVCIHLDWPPKTSS